ncbi:MAG: site-specific DNA-methyltransferase [Chloroflexi bacterium]|nr:site-specific DNA-methyltransferase [Chloroflexota bacterium]
MLPDDILLKNIDWDFPDSVNNSGIHAIHPYPAKFIPQIPRELINLLYTDPSTSILDTFSGSGTTLVEAMRAGIDAYGIDLHPLACLIAKVKTTPIPSGFEDIVSDVALRARTRIKQGNVDIPLIPRLDHWFKPHVQEALAALIDEIRKETDEDIEDALSVALSSIIVQVSNQESDTRYAAIDKPIHLNDVFDRFRKAAVNLSVTLQEQFNGSQNRIGKATILNRDILMVKASELPQNVGLVITSPPYPNAYEYWLYHKYRMYWLGMDPITVKNREIGARAHYFKKNHQDEHDFERQMGMCFNLLSQVMVPDGIACFVVGRSIIHGRKIDNTALLSRAAKPHGFVVREIVERRIPASRKSFNPSHGKINREHLIVFTLSESS